MKKRLETVTLLGIDCVNVDRLQLAMALCTEHFEFAEVKLLTSLPVPEGVPAVSIEEIGSVEAYSQFVIQHLNEYVDTPYVLIVQHDGFILNPAAWTDDFLQYDYIGAPWWVKDWSITDFGFPHDSRDTWLVGNGGFSLRSKKLLQVCTLFAHEGVFSDFHPEDVQLCVRHRAELEHEGVRFAPVELAQQFSYEAKDDMENKWNGQFGFHGLTWTDITNWIATHPGYVADMKTGTFKKI